LRVTGRDGGGIHPHRQNAQLRARFNRHQCRGVLPAALQGNRQSSVLTGRCNDIRNQQHLSALAGRSGGKNNLAGIARSKGFGEKQRSSCDACPLRRIGSHRQRHAADRFGAQVLHNNLNGEGLPVTDDLLNIWSQG